MYWGDDDEIYEINIDDLEGEVHERLYNEYLKVYKESVYQEYNEDTIDIFDSELTIADKVTIRVPIKILNICKVIQSKVNHNEFSILVKATWKKNILELTEDYIIPKQTVSSASVDYTEDLNEYKKQGYNVVIHSHPFKSSSFSRDDIETINAHFTASILYSCGEFTRAVITVPLNNETKLQIDAEIEMYIPELNEDIDISNIQIEYPYRTNKNKSRKRFRNNIHFY